MLRICTLLMRSQSKGLKDKNVRSFLGKPLFVYTLMQAEKSNLFDVIAVSSDSQEYLELAVKWGAKYVIERPKDLASDSSGKIPAIQHCVLEIEKKLKKNFSTVVDLDVTSPLRLIEDIKNAIFLLENNGFPNVITTTPARHSPYFNMIEENESQIQLSKKLKVPVLRRQDAPKCYDMNASIYVWKRDVLFESSSLWHQGTKQYVMPPERSIDIDSELDYIVAESIAKKYRRYEGEW